MFYLDSKVLSWCNAQRALRGLPRKTHILKGIRGRACACPIYHTLGFVNSVGPNFFTPKCRYRGGSTLMPDHVISWIRSFDRGDLPEYELKRARKDVGAK